MEKESKVLLKEFMQRWSELSGDDVSVLNWHYETLIRTVNSFMKEGRTILLKNFIKFDLRNIGVVNFHNLQTGKRGVKSSKGRIYKASLSNYLKYPDEE